VKKRYIFADFSFFLRRKFSAKFREFAEKQKTPKIFTASNSSLFQIKAAPSAAFKPKPRKLD